MALNKLGRVYSLAPGDASKLLSREVIERANAQKKAVGGKKSKDK